jgi:prolyl-tRNA synthetase
MLYSQIFPKTQKTAPADEESKNAKFLVRAGFADKLMAGVYSWLPLGLRVRAKVEGIIREEMNALGANEILMPALQPKENWDATKRWDSMDVLFKIKSQTGKEVALGPTHEEIVTPLAGKFIKSYKDLPFALYQIQNKFRDELRAKSGLLRGREFGMKDLYSFHADEKDLEKYYEKVAKVYVKLFGRMGLKAVRVRATGGAFSKFSDEFQVLTPNGEDTIYKCPKCKVYYNNELVKGNKCTEGHELEAPEKSVEVGNIFKLGTRFSDSFGLSFLDKAGKKQPVIMGCYGLGPTRVIGTIAELMSDDRGLIWLKSVAPYAVHLLGLNLNDKKIKKVAEDLYEKLMKLGIEALYDDRVESSAGEKFADADLIGIPLRLVISARSLEKKGVEWKERSQKEGKIVKMGSVMVEVKKWVK